MIILAFHMFNFKYYSFQYSGAVDDGFMVSLGKMIGATTVIAGTIYSIGSELRFNVRVIEIETAFVLASNGIDFESDKKVDSLLSGGTVETTLSREKIPIRNNNGSVSMANQELRENQKRTVSEAKNFFSKDFFDRKDRWLIGYNYFPEFNVSFEGGYLRNGLGWYIGMGFDINFFKDYDKMFSYIGEVVGCLNFYGGIIYPLFFNWLWIVGGIELAMVEIATSYTDYYYFDNYITSDLDFALNPSVGLYISYKRFYITAKYRYLRYGNNSHSFMLGLGIVLESIT